jgi:[acyl-carrier-protein] S-malonyltransferase
MTLDPKQTAFVFPGQGSQTVGMGKALAEQYPVARRVFEEADAVLGFSLSGLCWDGPDTELGETLNTQPALLAHSVAAWRVFTSEFGEFSPLCLAGHSMGEFSALVAAGALGFADGVRLVRERGRVMTEAGKRKPGGMAAILNLERQVLSDVCAQAARETGGIVGLANDNCPGQIVISGEVPALQRAIALAQERGAKRAIRLNVSIGSHSPLMEEAAREFTRAVNARTIVDPKVPLVGNTAAGILRTADAIRADVNAQLTSPVRWVDSVRAMTGMGAKVFVEFGPKDVLSCLIKRIDPTVGTFAAGTPEEIHAALGV